MGIMWEYAIKSYEKRCVNNKSGMNFVIRYAYET